jgi:excisionase family DNA binding protein
MSSTADQHGPFLRVEEAALALRISRTSAYAQARLWLQSGGTDRLPAVRIGRPVRIPATALDRLAAAGQQEVDGPVVLPLRDAS